MAGFLSFIFIIVLIALPISIIRPQIFSRFFNATRTKNALILGGTLSVLFVLIAVSAPAPESNSSTATDERNIQQENNLEINPTQPEVEEVTLAPSATPIPTNSPTPTKIPTPIPTKVVPTAIPKAIVYPTSTPIPQPVINSGGEWPCDCKKTCTEISSCAEAQYLLNSCGCGARDGDKDGIACDSNPLNCQN